MKKGGERGARNDSLKDNSHQGAIQSKIGKIDEYQECESWVVSGCDVVVIDSSRPPSEGQFWRLSVTTEILCYGRESAAGGSRAESGTLSRPELTDQGVRGAELYL